MILQRPKSFASVLVSSSVFLLAALALVVPSGYSLGALMLLLMGLGYVWVRPLPRLASEDICMLAALAVYFVVGVVTNLVHHLDHSSYDNLSRFLLVIPVMLLLLRFPIKPGAIWLGLALGALGAALLAVWDFYIQGDWRAAGHTNAIQFGDIAVLFSCLLAAGLGWANSQGCLLVALLVLGIAGGIVASLLSGARGGWLMLPIAALLIYWWSGIRSITTNLLFAIVTVLIVAALLWLPGLEFLRERITHVALDLQTFQDKSTADNSVGTRLHLWQLSLDMIAQRPWLGWGSLEQYIAITGAQDELLVKFNHVHNELLDAWVKRGLFGAAALLGIYLVPGVMFYRKLRQHSGVGKSAVARAAALAGLLLVVATAVFGLSQSFLTHSSGVTLFTFLWVILWSVARERDMQPPHSHATATKNP